MLMTLIFGTVCWLAFVWIYLSSAAKSMFHPATYYLFFHGLVFTFRPWLNWYYGYNAIYDVYKFKPSENDQIFALVAANLGLVCFMVAVMLVGRRRLDLKPTISQPIDVQRQFRWAFFAVSMALMPLALYSAVTRVDTKILGSSSMSMVNGISVNTTTSGYFSDAGNLMIPIAVGIAWLFRFKWWSFIPFAAYAFLRASDGGGRWTFLLSTASLCLLYMYDRRSKWVRLELLVPAVAALVLFTALGDQRDLVRVNILGQAPNPMRAIEERDAARLRPMEDMNYANQEFLEYLVHVIPNRTGTYGYFLDNLQVFTEPIPRIYWPDKPIGAPIKKYDLWAYGTPIGMTFSLPGEGWSQFGFLGVAIWCGLFGVIWGWIYNSFAKSLQTEFVVLLYCLILPLSVQFFRDGTLITAVKFPAFYVLPLLLWWFVSYGLSRRKAGFIRSIELNEAITAGASAPLEAGFVEQPKSASKFAWWRSKGDDF